MSIAGAGPVVFHDNVGDRVPLSSLRSSEYETLDAVALDGWMVD